MEIVPFSSDPAQEFVCDLGGAAYLFAARYNERSESWTVDITRQSDQAVLLAGVPMLLGQDLLAPYALGIGGISGTDLDNTDVDPGPEDNGDRVIWTWFSPAEQTLIREALAALNAPAVVPSPGAASTATAPAPTVSVGADRTRVAMELIPFTSDPAQEFTCQLGDAYRISARYNERSESWTMDLIREADEAVLVAGVPMLLGQDILAPYSLGIGGITGTDLANTDVDPGADPEDMGGRVIWTWLSPAAQALVREALAALNAPAVVPPPGAPAPPVDPDDGDDDPVVIPDPGTGGGSSGPAIPTGAVVAIYAPGPFRDDSGDEVLPQQAEAAGNFANLPTLAHFDFSFYALSDAGNMTIRMYVGGTPNTIDGTLRATLVVPSGAMAITGFSGSFANPGGRQPIKFTIESSAPGVIATIANLVGSFS